ncbi:hypothetical protein B0H14DRAFT_2651744 [Mycena olivaceomarginata]|nr:hypothetical protein B0H14DRAFT_2651744 [Mycena olivaceomarginata]
MPLERLTAWNTPHHTDSTADIKTVFHRRKGQKDPQTGAIIKEGGTTCLVCTRKGVTAQLCFLTGSASTLRSYIARHEDHFEVYQARCKALNIRMHPHAIPQHGSLFFVALRNFW